ncbi:MAG: NAD(P)H-hydrate epimerase, partial [Gemmatimonadales bacterium]
IRATATMTLALPKTGLQTETAKDYVGELYLADIGVPNSLYREIGLDKIPLLFSHQDVIRL